MRSVRLLPIVIFAACALLLLKGFGLVTQGGYVLAGMETAMAQTGLPVPAMPQPSAGDAQEETPGESSASELRNIEAADRASQNLFSRAAPTPAASGQIDAVPVEENNYGEKVPLGATSGVQQTERAVLERLGERRTELEIREQELAARAALVEAAEKRLAERIAGLEALESRISSLVDERKNMNSEQFSAIVGMYENMRPKDAAAIFDTLGMDVLLRVARAMNPRKMSPILAGMSTERATELTAMLADVDDEPSLDGPIDELGDLPQIVGN